MRRFRLVRNIDETGVSGTGIVCEGVQFTDGNVATRWLNRIAQTCVWDSIEDMEAIHGHNGNTVVVWMD